MYRNLLQPGGLLLLPVLLQQGLEAGVVAEGGQSKS